MRKADTASKSPSLDFAIAENLANYGDALAEVANFAFAGYDRWRTGWHGRSVRRGPLLETPLVLDQLDGTEQPSQAQKDSAIEEAINRAVLGFPDPTDKKVAMIYLGLAPLSGKDPGHVNRQEAAGDAQGVTASGFRTRPATSLGHDETIIAAVAAALFKVSDPLAQTKCTEVIELVHARREKKDEASPTVQSHETKSVLDDLLGNAQIPEAPELVIAIARPLGTDTGPLLASLEEKLSVKGYRSVPIKLSALIEAAAMAEGRSIPSASESKYKRIRALMETGDRIRTEQGSGAATAALAVWQITQERDAILSAKSRQQAIDGSPVRVAFIVTNLMHPEEVSALRRVYKSRFFLLGVFGDDEANRQATLAGKLKEEGDSSDKEAKDRAEELVDIDAGKIPATPRITDGSLSVNRTFHHADVFLRASKGSYEQTLKRFVDQAFSDPFGTLYPEELAMSAAYMAAKRSSALARQVGAAIVAKDGSILSLGWNDPIKLGGHPYSDNDDAHDHREEKEGSDPSDAERLGAVMYFLNMLAKRETWDDLPFSRLDKRVANKLKNFSEAARGLPTVDVSLVAALATVPNISSSRLLNLIEFGRCVHAEMLAISSAARRGVNTDKSTMYVTTFPCHECARNIIAAGIEKVVYVEPYPKSLSKTLYKHEAVFYPAPPETEDRSKVQFVPYDGIAPNAADRLFSWAPRKWSIKDTATDISRVAGNKRTLNGSDKVLRESVAGYDVKNGGNQYHEVAVLLAEQSLLSRFAFVEKLNFGLLGSGNNDTVGA